MGVPHHDPFLPIGFWNNIGYTKPPKFMFQIKRQRDSIDHRAHGRPCDINPSTGTPSTMDEDGLVLRDSRRPTRAPILASLGARLGVQDSSATSSTHRTDAFAALSAPKCIAFVYCVFDCCVYCRRVYVASILYLSVRLSPPPSALPRSCACCCRPPLLRILVSYQL